MHNLHYYISFIVMFMGLYVVLADRNYYRKIIGLSIFQSAIILFYVSTGYIFDSKIPILKDFDGTVGSSSFTYTNPLPQVLMLTAIVVGLATMAVGLALVRCYYHRHREGA